MHATTGRKEKFMHAMHQKLFLADLKDLKHGTKSEGYGGGDEIT